MVPRSMNKAFIVSLVSVLIRAVAAALCCAACDNPFANSMGDKVDVEKPTVTIMSPKAGTIITGDDATGINTVFTGKATAYNELRLVEIMVIDQNDTKAQDSKKERRYDWMDIAKVGTLTGGPKEKQWSFSINTLDYDPFNEYAQPKPLEDGYLKLQLRATDPTAITTTKEIIYIVKNNPSTIKMTFPDPTRLENNQAEVATNTDIKLQVIDRRGIKPGYPRIKIWRDADYPNGEPPEAECAWAQMFQAGFDSTEEPDKGGYSYKDRSNEQVSRVANFVFRLSESTMNAHQITYTVDPDTGNYTPLLTGIYRFRIISRETFFYDDIDQDGDKYLKPRAPVYDSGNGPFEVEKTAYYPRFGTDSEPPDALDNGPSYLINVVSTLDPPGIRLANDDVAEEALNAIPNIYIQKTNDNKITTASLPVGRKGKNDFRLRLLISHTEPIARAELSWTNVNRLGDLQWDVPDGALKNPDKEADGKYFQFTAQGDETWKNNQDEPGSGPAFVSSGDPYTFTVKAWTQGGSYGEQNFNLYLDGEGPSTGIRSLRGAAEDPDGDSLPVVINGVSIENCTVNTSAYIVNGNIQVAVDPGVGIDEFKWAVEEITAANNDYDHAALYTVMMDYRGDPSKVKLKNVYDAMESSAGWGTVSGPAASGSAEDMSYNMKFCTWNEKNDNGVNWWHGKDLWLYFIVRDKLGNLGFVMQKLSVDDDTDIPVLTMPSLHESRETITITDSGGNVTGTLNIDGPEKLYYGTNKDKLNILDPYSGIDITMQDDDGIKLNDVTITLFSLANGACATLSTDDLIERLGGAEGDNKTEWIGVLTQKILADALYRGNRDLNTVQHLDDGLYQLNIEIIDNIDAKVKINAGDVRDRGNIAIATQPPLKTFYFAVQSDPPDIAVAYPGESAFFNEQATSEHITMHGTVKSRLEIQSLTIKFKPDIISAADISDAHPAGYYADKEREIDLFANNGVYRDAAWTVPAAAMDAAADSDGYYTYYWKRDDVDFDPVNLFIDRAHPLFDNRDFSLAAVDGMGTVNILERSVQIDTTPPTVELAEFNFGRLPDEETGKYIVNGKVPFAIRASDAGGIKRDDADDGYVNIRWWVLPASTIEEPTWNGVVFSPEPNGAGEGLCGQFTKALNIGNDTYRVVINTNTGSFTEGGDYVLYAIAEDKAGNFTGNGTASVFTVLVNGSNVPFTFTVDQSSDYPVLKNPSPAGGDNDVREWAAGVKITGTVFDDDGFNAARVKYMGADGKPSYTETVGGRPAYIQIVFNWNPANPDTNPDNKYTNRYFVPAALNSAGEIDFSLDLNAEPFYNSGSGERHPYFRVDGIKKYRIEITDEDQAGGNNNPPGKNPACAVIAPSDEVLQAVTGYWPLEDTGGDYSDGRYWYSFQLKNHPPKIYFDQWDPDDTHPGYSDVERPTLRTQDELYDMLTGDQNGGSFVQSAKLDSISFIYNGVTRVVPLTLSNPGGDNDEPNYLLQLTKTWLDDFDSLPPSGSQTITVVATDTAGVKTSVDWKFNKDAEGPLITPDNISFTGVAGAIGSGGALDIVTTSITGQLEDNFSPLWDFYQYRFVNKAGKCLIETAPGVFEWQENNTAWNTVYFDEHDFGNNRRSASWTVTVPGSYNDAVFPDGEYIFAMKAFDKINNDMGNDSSYSTRLLVDRKDPQISGADNMMVKGGLYNGNEEVARYFTEKKERVFAVSNISGDPDAVAFTLSGVIYEHNLSAINATINSDALSPVSLEEIEAWVNDPGSCPPWAQDITAGNITIGGLPYYQNKAGNLRIRQAKTDGSDFGATINDYQVLPVSQVNGLDIDLAHSYIWELDIRKGILEALITANSDEKDARTIDVVATDLAGSASAPQTWQFYLDNTPPEIAFAKNNLEFDADPGNYDKRIFYDNEQPVVLKGTATDDNNIKEIRYLLAQWDYSDNAGEGGWRYYNMSSHAWEPTQYSQWSQYSIPGTGPQSRVDWVIDSAELQAAGYPVDLLRTYGKYRLDLHITDYSMSSSAATAGNPTTIYEPGPVFFIDDGNPQITWDSLLFPPNGFYTAGNDGTGITFTFDVTDANTIQTVQARLSGTGVPPAYNTTSGNITVSVAYDTAVPWHTKGTATLTLKTRGTGLADGKYTLELDVSDGAGNKAKANNTFTFNLDQEQPQINIIDPVASQEALVGRVVFQGNFSKTFGTSAVSKVAYYVNKNGDTTVPDSPDDSGWHFVDGSNFLKDTENNIMMNIVHGNPTYSLNANVYITNTRYLEAAGYLQPSEDAVAGGLSIPAGLKFNGEPLNATNFNGYTTDDLYALTVYFLAVDAIGNYTIEPLRYWVYPKGDYPTVNISSPDPAIPAGTRPLNAAQISIGGSAADNNPVKNVWFRVLDEGGHFITLDDQTLYSITDQGNWYKANDTEAWSADINNNGELNPTGDATERLITIEAMSEDYIEVDSWNTNVNAAQGLYSEIIGVSAIVSKGLPLFSNERIVNRSSADLSFDNPLWGNIADTNIRKRAAYSITVAHNTGLRAIFWTNNGVAINLLDDTAVYNTTTYQHDIADMDDMDAISPVGPGIAAKAMPKALTDTLESGKTYMIWDPIETGATLNIPRTVGGLLPESDNVRYTFFTLAGTASITLTGTGRVMEKTVNGFEWVVLVDLNTDRIPYPQGSTGSPYYGSTAGKYIFNLSASDVAGPNPNDTPSRKVTLVIDNKAPEGELNINTKIAGSNETISGTADDAGDVGGVAKIVLWFSRNGHSIPWNDNDAAASEFVAENDSAILAEIAGWYTGSVEFPQIPDKNALVNSNYSCIVIDQSVPPGTERYGHKLNMTFSKIGGERILWDVTLDTTRIISGHVTVHYVVYDKAGNAVYGYKDTMIMNNIPVIGSITLGTDIRGDLDLQGTAQLNSASSNLTFNTGDTGVEGAIQKIKNAFNNMVAGNSAMGIIENIPINTDTVGSVFDSPFSDTPFNVRNKLLAIGVNIGQAYSTKLGRHFRVEYVSGAQAISAGGAIKAGRVYIIEDPGSSFPWNEYYERYEGERSSDHGFAKGFAFLATKDGTLSGSASAWELNSTYYNGTPDTESNPYGREIPATALALDDVAHPKNGTSGDAMSAEFVYGASAFDSAPFGTPYTQIHDMSQSLSSDKRIESYSALKITAGWQPWEAHSLFIVRVFDGAEDEFFGDFALLSINVNNNDITPPYSQLYDLNPKTEAAGSSFANALNPQSMGGNRAKGGLYNTTESVKDIAKSGHIEPRMDTSLSSAEMGGAANNASAGLTKPTADTNAFFTVDTVSGRVILRGYAEDDQKITAVDLVFTDRNTPANTQTVTIVQKTAATPQDLALVGCLEAGADIVAADISIRETLDLTRHRVEWAWYWDTQAIPVLGGNALVVGDISVRVIAYNADAALARKTPSPPREYSDPASKTAAFDYYNPGFPDTDAVANLYRYNAIDVNIRPYITGFKRNSQEESLHNNRSRQGRYMFARGETLVVAGFNLGGGGTGATTISLPGMADTPADEVADGANFGITPDAANYRIFQVDAGAVTGNGLVTLKVDTYEAVNTGDARPIEDATLNTVRPAAVQPWNKEYNLDGSELWDDFTMVHIWQSNNDNSGTDNARFYTTGGNWSVEYPSMSIAPATGILWASWIEGGSTVNTGNMVVSNNTLSTTNPTRRLAFVDPVIMSDIYYSPGDGSNGASEWAVASIIGRAGRYPAWSCLGGIYFYGPGGANANLSTNGGANSSSYLVEGTYYNASVEYPGRVADPPTTDQFENPHIVTSLNGGNEHLHVSYYDSKDGSIKYRYNRRGSPGTIFNADNTQVTVPYAWTNLDGGYDEDDQWQFNDANGPSPNVEALPDASTPGGYYTGPWPGITDPIAQNGRIVNYSTRSGEANHIDAGRHNAIAVTGDGYPVIAYYDETNQQLKMAISNSVVPIAADHWKIITSNEIFAGSNSRYQKGTGEYVSLKIDTQVGATQNTFHIAALNSIDKNLVYIKGRLTGTGFFYDIEVDSVQIVDSSGDVGRWCSLSLDENGNPWISYHDESYSGAKDGVKVAYYNPTVFSKGIAATSTTGTGKTNQDVDINKTFIGGWEAMHVPTQFNVENARVALECYPTRNFGGTATKFWGAAVGYLAPDYFRIAYYVK